LLKQLSKNFSTLINHVIKIMIMGNILYLVAVILVIAWAVGYLGGYTSSGLIHILLVIAIIAIILRVIEGRRL